MRIKSIFNKKSGVIILFTLLMIIMIADSPATFNIIEKIPKSEEILTSQKIQSPIQDNLNFETDYEMIASYGWDLPEVIKDPAYINDLKIAIDNDDNAHILWSGRDGDYWYLYHIIKFNSSDSWSSINTIGTTTSSIYGLMDVKSDAYGNIHLVWLDNSEIKYKFYSQGQWSEDRVIDTGSLPRIYINNENKPKIVYTKYISYRNNFFCVTKKSSNTWEYQMIPLLSTYYYNIISSNYDFLVTYNEGIERLFFMRGMIVETREWPNIYYNLHYNLIWKENESMPFTWSGYNYAYNLPQTFHHVAQPLLISSNNGDVHFIHQVIESVDEYSLAYQKRNTTGYWNEAVTLTDKASLKCQMTGAVDSFGRIVLVWNHKITEIDQPTTAGIYLKFLSAKTHQWTNDILFNPDHGYSQYPNLAIDSAGNIHMVWLDQKDENRTLYYRKGYVDTDEDGLIDKDEQNTYFTDPYDDDTDDDNLLDGDEIANGLDPFNQDSDSDGMYDGYEFHNELNPYVNDSTLDFDNDLLINIDEFLLGTLPNNNDTDNDSLNDYDEVMIYFTNPKKRDTDSDKLEDAYEINVVFSNPNSWDTDNDTMNDWYEDIYGIAKGGVLDILVNDSMLDPDTDGLINMLECQWGLYPDVDDTDDDGLLDGEEVLIYFTHPIDKDTDKDGLFDGLEVYGYLYPANPWSDPMGYFYTNPLLQDSDGDNVNDKTEIINMMNPNDPDTDDDLMWDGYEYLYRNNPGLNASDGSDALIDYDQDGLTSLEEFYLWTHPNKTDTDSDKLYDLEEVLLGSDPTKWDTDFDGLNDYNELILIGTNVTNPDTDFDGLNDYLEVLVFYSNPFIVDSDGDTIIDGDEVYIYGSHPMNTDSDEDSLKDNIEIIFGSDPTLEDTDFDGMDDYFEWLYGLDPQFDDSEIDMEEDGVPNGEECQYNSNPLLPDSDFDNLTDYEEIALYFTRPDHIDTDLDHVTDYDEIFIYFTSPHDPDTDDDRVFDGIEISIGTDPLNLDTDGDGISDGQELLDKTDPLDPSDNRIIKRTRRILISFSTIIGLIVIYYFSPMLFGKLRRDSEKIWVREGVKKRKQKSDKFLNTNESSIESND